MRVPGLVLALTLAALSGAQTATHLPLIVTGADGLGFDSTTDGMAAVLVGFAIPETGPLTAMAPQMAPLGGDGQLGKVSPGPWKGPIPTKVLRVEKPGFAVAGVRVLVSIAGKTVKTRQFQVYFKPWTDGALASPGTWSKVYGTPAGDKDTTKIVELQVSAGAWPTGWYGTTNGGELSQFSLVQRPDQQTVAAPAAQPLPAARVVVPPEAPKAPLVPAVDLKR